MNLLLLFDTDFVDKDTAVIHDHRLTHLQTVLKSTIGDSVTAGKLNGKIGNARIVSMDTQQATLDTHFDQEPPAASPLTVVLALPRPQMLKRIVHNIAEFGIKELHLIHSQKVEKSYWQTPNLHADNINSYLQLGLMQAKDTILPTIYQHKQFKTFISDALPQLMQHKTAFIAHPYADKAIPHASDEPRLIIIGPEGGFSNDEIAQFTQHGVIAVHMGERIYKVENALSFLVAKLT